MNERMGDVPQDFVVVNAGIFVRPESRSCYGESEDSTMASRCDSRLMRL